MLYPLAVETVVVAFRVAALVATVLDRLQSRPEGQSWSTIVGGHQVDFVGKEIDTFNKDHVH